MNLHPFTGPAALGKAYQFLLENDAHAPGSIDREMIRSMVRLCPVTMAYFYQSHTPLEAGYVKGWRPGLEAILAEHVPGHATREEYVPAIARFTRRLGQRAEQDPRKMAIGGTEEAIVKRGSDWCADVARVACALYQVAGFPCRIVYLFDLDHAYSGHVIVEAYRSGAWGAVDSSSGVVYRKPDGTPATTWDLMNSPELIGAHQGPEAWYTNTAQFKAAGISNYFCSEVERYDYSIAGMNEYYLSILAMAGQGWPGGLRWLHGEDQR